MEAKKDGERMILIAPSWQKGNIVDSCLESLLKQLKVTGYRIVVRPHPQHVRHQPEKMERLKTEYEKDDRIEIQTDFSSNHTVFAADMIITDWSDIAYEYAYTTYKPVLFIDTPMKIMNPEYRRIDTEPINIWMREVIGKIIKPEDIGTVCRIVDEMLSMTKQYETGIRQVVEEYVYHPGQSTQIGAKYLIRQLQKAAEKRKEVGK